MATRGRPSGYTPERASSICDWIASGKSLRSWLKAEGVSFDAVYRWLNAHDDFREQYARARAAQADALFDEIQEIADDPTFDWVERYNPDGKARIEADYEHIQRSKLRIDARKWIAARLAPRKYGDFQRHEVEQHTVSTSPEFIPTDSDHAALLGSGQDAGELH